MMSILRVVAAFEVIQVRLTSGKVFSEKSALLDLLVNLRRDEHRPDVKRSHEDPQRCRRCVYRAGCGQKLGRSSRTIGRVGATPAQRPLGGGVVALFYISTPAQRPLWGVVVALLLINKALAAVLGGGTPSAAGPAATRLRAARSWDEVPLLHHFPQIRRIWGKVAEGR